MNYSASSQSSPPWSWSSPITRTKRIGGGNNISISSSIGSNKMRRTRRRRKVVISNSNTNALLYGVLGVAGFYWWIYIYNNRLFTAVGVPQASQVPAAATPKPPAAPAAPATKVQKKNEKTTKTTQKKYSILPKRIYTVVGLESSGTKFVTQMITDALNLTDYREGSFRYGYAKITNAAKTRKTIVTIDDTTERHETNDVQVQHLSLPWGSTCKESPNVSMVDVILPSQCSAVKSRSGRSIEIYSKKSSDTHLNKVQCSAMTQELWGFGFESSSLSSSPLFGIVYPPRFYLNVVSQMETMTKWGVEQYFIIVLRDRTVAHKSRMEGDHCARSDLVHREEEVGRQIIIEAINKYILKNNQAQKQTQGGIITQENFDFWKAETFQQSRRRLTSLMSSSSGSGSSDMELSSNSDRMNSNNGVIPMGNNVVLVSYESLMLLKEPYVQMLYEALGIESNFIPFIKDGNVKHVEKVKMPSTSTTPRTRKEQ